MDREAGHLKRPWNTPLRVLAWFLVLTVSAFGLILVINLVTGGRLNVSDLLHYGLPISVGLAGAALGAFWFFRWVSCWKNFRRFLFVTACLVTLVLLAYAEENWRGKRAWERHRQYWESRGEHFKVAAFVPPQVPEEKNFALTPLLRPLFEFTRNGAAIRDTNPLADLDKLSAQLSGQGKSSVELGNPQKGTLADLTAWAQFYRGNTNYPQAPANTTPADTILVAVSKFSPELKELREAAASRPYSRFAIDYNSQPPWAILVPHLSRVKALTVLTHVRAVAELEAKRAPEAFEDSKLAFRLSESLRDEPILIDHLVRTATLGMALQTLREGIARHAWSDAQLAEIESYLGSINLLAEYKNVMRCERALSSEGLDYLRGRAVEVVHATGGDLKPSMGVWPSGWYYQNMLTISRLYQESILPAVNEQARRVFPDITEAEESRIIHMRAGPYTIFAKLLMPALQKAVIKTARMQTCVDCARVACALERYNLAKGTTPASLDLLLPAFIDRIPNDVIDGNPLRYRLDSKGNFVLYSVGWNRTDDRGELAWRGEKKPGLDESKGDWVWTALPREQRAAP